ncbi:TonB-dependent receptor [Sphingobium nicotianae]|uniref:TonB-dependent receptor n=1 Tax=Sphingobium nicotianae TaxID=2782607 RepID=A0A9X1DFK7_9SPHN|nr:TonB-dependent receptor [Sphingobium nicotianae]MBT2188959.1 TonB-dependent receptor [Sphingobium nicotianae]
MNNASRLAQFLRSAALPAILFGIPALPAHAQTEENPPPDTGTQHGHDQDHPEDIVVTAIIPRSHIDILGGTSVLTAEALVRDMRPNLGETLARQPGVSATSFGPNASRPILRGFSGDRIRLLTDGIGSFDVSATSADHAVAINPLLADRIEVLHGPAALLYGSSAVGGVVNVIDSRIPTRIPPNGYDVQATGTYGSAAEERSLAGKTDVSVGGGFVLHADGTYTRTSDMRVGDFVLAPAVRDAARASGDPKIAALADLKDRVPNTASEGWSYGGGFAYVGSGGSIGASVSQLHNFYGVPVRYSTDPGGTSEHTRIRMDQTRADLRASVPVDGKFLDEIKLRAGWADYHHDEIEQDGSVGTSFFAQGMEARLELVQARRGGWDGAFGGQMVLRKTSIVGDEKFLPDVDSETYGLFTLQSLDLGDVRFEAGGRFEHNHLFATADSLLGIPDTDRKFDTLSGSLGLSYAITPDWRAGLSVSRTERAPTADELFARGNHAGTQAFELGDPNFKSERGWGVEGNLHGRGRDYHLTVSLYYNKFDRFIYDSIVPDAACLAANHGNPLDFPCFAYQQTGAEYYGAEVEGEWTAAKFGDTKLNFDGLADVTRATLKGGAPVPRIPPLRLLGGAALENPHWNARLEAEHDFAQNRVSGLETATPAFTLVNASLGWKPAMLSNRLSLTLSANNIFDVTARRAASLLKDYAPLPGRDIRVTVAIDL